VRGPGPLLVAMASVFAVVAPALPATAWPAPQAPSPMASAAEVDGQVAGDASAGGRLSMRVDATVPGGWRGLHLVEFRIVQEDRELEQVDLDVDNGRLIVAGRYLLVGTEAVGQGTYVRVPASEVVVTTGGDHLSVRIEADVLRAIPEDATFQLSVTDDSGATSAVARSLSAAGSDGPEWGTVLAIVIAAVFAGAFAGNLLASRRRPPPRLSVYGAVQRRIHDERSSGPPTAGSR
jgi:hypothetical protein